MRRGNIEMRASGDAGACVDSCGAPELDPVDLRDLLDGP